MKICYLGNARSIHVQRWIKFFSDNGHEVHIFSFDSTDIRNAELHQLRRFTPQLPFIFSPINLITYVIQIKRLIKRIKPDILHAHYIHGYGVIGALTGFHPFVASAWGSDIFFTRNSSIQRAEIKYALNRADLITCNGENLKKAILEHNIDKNKIQIIYHGVDTKEFNPKKRDNKIARKIFGNENSQIVISTRSLEPIYDIVTLIRAIPLILKRMPLVNFLIIGGGSEKSNLVKLAQSYKILDRIKFLGSVSHMKLPKLLLASDVYVSTSLSDGTAISTLEAMACGVAPVITDIVANRIWIKNDVNGFMFPKRDPIILAEKIVCTLRNKKVIKKFAELNTRMVKEKADYYKEMGKMEDLYEKLVKKI